MSSSKYSKEELYQLLVIENLSYEDVGRRFNCTGSYIRKLCRKLEVYVPKKRKINSSEHFNKGRVTKFKCLNCGGSFVPYNKKSKYCSRGCAGEYRAKENYNNYLVDQESYCNPNKGMSWIKPFLLKEQDNKCLLCGNPPIHNKKSLVFVLDHIDGDAGNNKKDNLRLVCPNCDSQLPTFKSRGGRKSTRHYYRYGKHRV